ncbi:MAG TPA: hypothetical protein VN619_00650 [Lacisediminihabitans sp.]|nr:hypothetical protein [Lacisediminihabitans sp.]HXD60411.1 hypothetical protein [Lacisediminihabitans sp.]
MTLIAGDFDRSHATANGNQQPSTVTLNREGTEEHLPFATRKGNQHHYSYGGDLDGARGFHVYHPQAR